MKKVERMIFQRLKSKIKWNGVHKIKKSLSFFSKVNAF